MKRILWVFLTVCLICGCATNLKYEKRGDVMKRKLHFCTYEIWDGFKEDVKYKFLIQNEEGYADIKISSIVSDDKLDAVADMDLKKQFIELKKEKEDKWISDIRKEKVKIGGNKGMKLSYEFSKWPKTDSDFEEFKKMKRVYYISNEASVTKVEIKTLSHSLSPVEKYVEEFCQSYKADDSQKVKTPWGSFKWVEGLIDESSFEYYVTVNDNEDERYFITINYVADEDKADYIESAEGSVSSRMLERFAASVSFDEDTYKVDGYKIESYKRTIRPSTQSSSISTVMYLMDVSPGIEIEIDASEKSYRKYEPQLMSFISSLKFFPEYSK